MNMIYDIFCTPYYFFNVAPRVFKQEIFFFIKNKSKRI